MIQSQRVLTVDMIKADNIGEFVTVEGVSAGYFVPREQRTPYALRLKDKSDNIIRVTAWPDIFERVSKRDLLHTTGTHVIVTAEVAEHDGELELHLQDWEELRISETTAPLLSVGSSASGSDVTTGSISVAPESTVSTGSILQSK